MALTQTSSIFVWVSLFCICGAYFGTELKAGDRCFCKLEGRIDDCSCSVDTVDYFNNMKIYPRLRSLLLKDYFRFYKVNLNKECPFWSDDSRCAIRYCHVEACLEEDIPVGLKGRHLRQPSFEDDALLKVFLKRSVFYHYEILHPGFKSSYMSGLHLSHPSSLFYDISILYSREAQNHDCEADHDKELGYLNTTISAAAYEEFARWKVHDDATDNFCVINGEDEEAQYVDLLLNPERYTGYKGKSAHRIWNSIYKENCFRPKNSYRSYIETSNLNVIFAYGEATLDIGMEEFLRTMSEVRQNGTAGMCLEKRVFYRVISGLHTSINIHLCSKFLLSDKTSLGLDAPGGRWGPNIEEFHRRFDPNTTNGEGPQWLRNLYFLYLLELRALAKAAPYLIREEYYTGNEQEDEEVRKAMRDLLQIVKSFPGHFNESVMFNGGKQARKLKDEFRQHFRNISRIMDCVGCEKCKLWGKLQIHGLGTALKILFSGKFDDLDPSGTDLRHLAKSQFQLDRNEIVAFINAFGRLSTSIFELEMFREMMR